MDISKWVLGVTFAGLIGATAPAMAESQLTVLNWKAWGTDEPWALEEFKKHSDAKVVHDYISSFGQVVREASHKSRRL